MSIPGWHLVRLASEAESEIVGAVIDSMRHDPATGRMIFTLGSRRGKRYVVVGVRGDRQIFLWTHKKSELAGYDSYQPTERFNRLKGARLVGLMLPQADRLLRADFVRPEGAAPQEVSLWIGWIGKAGNIWLADSRTGHVLETQWKTSEEVVGTPFVPPRPPALADWRTIDFPGYLGIREERAQDSLGELVPRRFWGVDTFVADRIQQEFEGSPGFSGDPESAESRWGEFTAIVGYLRKAVDPRTRIELIPHGNGSEVAPHQEGSESEIFPTLAAALVARDNSVREESGRESQIAQVLSAIEKQLKRAQRRLTETQRAIDAAGEAETLKHQADLLGAQRHLMRRGMTEVSVADWKSGETMTLPLSGKLSPQDNIEEYYQRARKTIRAAENARTVLPQLRAEIAHLSGLQDELDSDDLPEERIAAIGAGLGVAATSAKPAKRVQQPRLAYREFVINDFTILVGRSNRENDEVTFRVARPDDLFLHADQVSGSHVILRSKGRGMEFPSEMVTMAAQIAAHFSKARHSGLVSVIYTPVRHVSKPRKAPPGLVRVQREKSLMVRPLRPPGYRTGDD